MEQTFTKAEMLELKKAEEGKPIVQRWFKHKHKVDSYSYHINIFELGDYDEVK